MEPDVLTPAIAARLAEMVDLYDRLPERSSGLKTELQPMSANGPLSAHHASLIRRE
jgi:hypothetical protein